MAQLQGSSLHLMWVEKAQLEYGLGSEPDAKEQIPRAPPA